MRNRPFVPLVLIIAVVFTFIALVAMPSSRFSWITLAAATYGDTPSEPAKPGVAQGGGNAIIQTASGGSLDIVSLGANGTSSVTLSITAAQLANLPAHPTKNTKIGGTSDNYVQVYKLTTGEYQANIGPDKEGKIFVYVFSVDPQECISHYEMNVGDSTPKFKGPC